MTPYRTAFLALALLAATLILPDSAGAQTAKVTLRTDIQGQTVQSPYLTYGEYRSAAIRHRGDGAASNPVTFEQLLEVSSLEEVERRIGEPSRVNKRMDPDGKQFTARLDYDGMKLTYVRGYDGVVRLYTFEIYGPAWELTVGGKTLRPGMSIDELDPAVREHIEYDTSFDPAKVGLPAPAADEVDGATVLFVEQPGDAPAGRGAANGVSLMEDTDTHITMYVDRERGVVTVVRFHRIVV